MREGVVTASAVASRACGCGRSLDGRGSRAKYCRECFLVRRRVMQNASAKARRAADPEKARAHKRSYYAANKDVIGPRENARQRAWRAANPDIARARGRDQARRAYAANRAAWLARVHAYYAANRDVVNARDRVRHRARARSQWRQFLAEMEATP